MYIKHLASVRENIHEKNHLARVSNQFQSWLAEEKKKITELEMIIPWFLENQRFIMDAVNAGCKSNSGHSIWNEKFSKMDQFTAMTLTTSKMSQFILNSHVCPEGGVINWGNDKKYKDGTPKPNGYKGWRGRINGTLLRQKKDAGSYPATAALNLVCLKTGTGGGGNNAWGFDVSIFLDDWAGLQHIIDNEERDAIIRRLRGKQ